MEDIDSSIDLNTTFNEWMSKVLDNEAGRTSDLKKRSMNLSVDSYKMDY